MFKKKSSSISDRSALLEKKTRSDGRFDYDQYKRIQTAGNKRKVNEVWASEEHVSFLSSYIESVIEQPEFGICHGTRNGAE